MGAARCAGLRQRNPAESFFPDSLPCELCGESSKKFKIGKNHFGKSQTQAKLISLRFAFGRRRGAFFILHAPFPHKATCLPLRIGAARNYRISNNFHTLENDASATAAFSIDCTLFEKQPGGVPNASHFGTGSRPMSPGRVMYGAQHCCAPCPQGELLSRFLFLN